ARAARARSERRGRPAETAGASSFGAVAFPDKEVQILPYNRTVKDLAGRPPAQFLKMLSDRFPVDQGSPTPPATGEVLRYLGGKWYSIDLKAAKAADGTRAGSLDVARLQRSVLEEFLNVGDVRTDKRIDFVGGARGTQALEKAVDSGKAAVAFSLYPVTVDDLM